MGNDVRRAYMCAFCEEDIHVERGEEDRASQDEHCGKLVEVMYGTRTAARMSQREAARTL